MQTCRMELQLRGLAGVNWQAGDNQQSVSLSTAGQSPMAWEHKSSAHLGLKCGDPMCLCAV